MTQTQEQPSDHSDEVAETGPIRARVRRTPWRGWLMAVPLAALILVGYLLIRTWLLTGPTITVTFPRSGGVVADSTVVKYKGMHVGDVSAVNFTDGLKRIRVSLDMHSSVASAINSGTRFWIVEPSLTSGDITSLLSGAYIAMRPGHGKPQSHFTGTIGAPALPPADKKGTVVTLTAEQKGSLGHGTTVKYRGIKAGQVLGASYDHSADNVQIKVFIKSPFDAHLHAGTRFWRTGGVGISTGNSGIAIDVPDISSLLNGGIAFADMAPGTPGDSAAASVSGYALYDNKDAAQHALAGPSALFSLDPPDSLHGLSTGAPVMLDGIKVGRVVATHAHYNLAKAAVQSTATIALYAAPLGIQPGSDNPDTQITQAVGRLIKHGMRARLGSGGLIFGGEQVVLDVSAADAGKGLDSATQPPRIPMAPGSGGGDILHIAAELSQIAGKINAIPIEDIGHNLQQVTTRMNKLSASPKLKQALANLDKSLANVKQVTAQASQQAGPTLQSLRGAAKAAEDAAQQISGMIGGQGGGANLSRLASELTRTARSIRVLTNYLQQHPDALLWGKNH